MPETVKDNWDMECPKCHQDDGISVQVKMWAGLHANGTDADGDQEWDDDSDAMCSCGFNGQVRHFKIPDEEPSEDTEAISNSTKGFKMTYKIPPNTEEADKLGIKSPKEIHPRLWTILFIFSLAGGFLTAMAGMMNPHSTSIRLLVLFVYIPTIAVYTITQFPASKLSKGLLSWRLYSVAAGLILTGAYFVGIMTGCVIWAILEYMFGIKFT